MAAPQERKDITNWRFDAIFAVVCVVVGLLGWRLWYLVDNYGEVTQQKAQRQQSRTITLPARVGSIYSSEKNRYVLMATSYQRPACFLDPLLLEDSQIAEAAGKIADILHIDALELQDIIIRNRKKRYVPLGDREDRAITDTQLEELKKLKIRAVGFEELWYRDYPCGPLAATLIGYRQRDGQPGGGLELSLDRIISASPGKRKMQVDVLGRSILSMFDESTAPRDGNNVYLCIDPIIQQYLQEAVWGAYQRYRADSEDVTWATGVVTNPQTGEILAMCSVPSFDPNLYNRPGSNYNNRAINMPFEPGSVIKPLFTAAAVNEGLVTYQTKIFCENGRYRAHKGGTITDHGKSYGDETVENGVVLSINTLMAKLGEKLGNERLYKYAKAYGFGGKSDVCLPGESAGIIRDLEKWDGYSLRRVPFGQEMGATALQLAMSFGALVNTGEVLYPRLIDRISTPDGRIIYQGKRRVVRRVLKPEVANQTLYVLQQVVERGTGKACQLRKWTSFGKTGTAQVPGPGGYIDHAYTGSFIGGAPVNNPRLLCVISVFRPDHSKGYYGATIAAPYVKMVLEKSLEYLNVPSDKTD